MKYLLDVNSLLAAIWVTHQNHAKVDAWLKGRAMVSCPIGELGFLRISTNPKAFNSDMPSARRLLKNFLETHAVEMIPDDLPALLSHAAKSSAVTDVYLAELAASKGLKLATLDVGIDHDAVEVIR